jgi:hypothetical protein
MTKKKNMTSNFEREEDREMKKIHRVGQPKKWKFDKNNVDKYYSEEYEDEYDERWQQR